MIQDDAVVASYGQQLSRGGIDFGVNLGRVSDLRLGAYVGRLNGQCRCRRSWPAGGRGQGGRRRAELAIRLAGQPRRADAAAATRLRICSTPSTDPDITPPLPTRPFERRADAAVGRGQPLLAEPASTVASLRSAAAARRSGRLPCRPINSRSADRSISARMTPANSAAITTTS